MATIDTRALEAELRGQPPERVLERAVQLFGDGVVMSSSFQTQSVPLLHMVHRVAPGLPVLFLDTGFHFPETLEFRDRLVDMWGLNLVVVRAQRSARLDLGPRPFAVDPDRCCHVNKVEPMKAALEGRDAWISGIRKDQTSVRSGAAVVQENEDGIVRIHPLLDWTEQDVRTYLHIHELPAHPLLDRGYTSVGCAPCTRPVQIDQDSRAGRWEGRAKTECGLHDLDGERRERSAG